MQTITTDGFSPSSAGMQRCKITPIHNANDMLAEHLLRMWADKAPGEVVEMLKKDDIEVTNHSDKSSQLNKLMSLSQQVGERHQAAQQIRRASMAFLDMRKKSVVPKTGHEGYFQDFCKGRQNDTAASEAGDRPRLAHELHEQIGPLCALALAA